MNALEKILGFKVKQKTKRKRYPATPEQKMMQNIRYVQRLIKRGDYDETNYQHYIKANKAIAEGYLDSDLNIIKEA